MKEFQDRRRARRKLYSRTSLIVLLVLILLMARGTWNIYQKEVESKQNLEVASKELASLQARHDLLQSQIDRLETPAGQEEEIRDKYQVAKPGEQMVVIIDATSGAPTTTASGSNSLWSDFLGLFKRK